MVQTTEHNVETGEIIVRPLTEDEIKKNEESAEFVRKQKLEFENQLAAKQALLNRLGITEEEAKLLLG